MTDGERFEYEWKMLGGHPKPCACDLCVKVRADFDSLVAQRVAEEREACAKVVDSINVDHDPDDEYTGRTHIARAIRRRGEER